MRWSPRNSLLLAFLAASLLLCSVEAHRDCYGSVGGQFGHVYQFDGGRVTTFAGDGCQFQLARSYVSRGFKLALYARFGCAKKKHRHAKRKATRLRALIVEAGKRTYTLLSRRRLQVNGKPVNVPYSEKGGVRAFLSGEDMVFVLDQWQFWVTYSEDGLTGTFRFGSRHHNSLGGLAGNCNGRRKDDQFGGSLEKAYEYWKKRRWVSGCKSELPPRERGCRDAKETHAAKKACARVIDGRGRCANTDVLKPCMIDYCGTRYRPDLQRRSLCASFYLHSRRCARHHRPLAWRTKSGCPLQCGRNQHFSRKANPCPKTCENHFFGTKRRCYKLPPTEGCRCNKGFVLDGSKCVDPKHCECLANLCIDRVSHARCRRWKSQGRCRRYPEEMGRFCRLTCGMCRPRCRNQISTQLCEQMKRNGKCREKFYRVMCKATCQPKKCRCPPRRVIRSKCIRRYRIKALTTIRWFLDGQGHCKKSTLTRYYPCGSCRYQCKTTWGNCNYCTGVQHGKRFVQYREKHGKHRCLQTYTSVQRKCPCPPKGKKKVVVEMKCRGNTLKVRITKTYKPTKNCRRCVRVSHVKVLRRIKCRGVVKTGACTKNRDSARLTWTKHYARNCRCVSKVIRRKTIRCRCPKAQSTRTCKGTYWLIRIKSWKLSAGKCIPRKSQQKRRVKCARNYTSQVKCRKVGECKAYRHIGYNLVRGCKCVRHTSRKHIGRCCCPRKTQRYERESRYWKRLIIVIYVRKGYRCHKKVIIRRIRTGCPKGSRYTRCNGRKGIRIHVHKWYVLKGNHCIKKVTKRKEKVKCRRGVKRISAGPCRLLLGHTRYRTVRLRYYERESGSCTCKRKIRKKREICGCRKGKHTKKTRCPKGCTTKNCGRHCQFTKQLYYYRLFGRNCKKRVLKTSRFQCCCRPNRRQNTRCSKNRFLVTKVSYDVLKAFKCQRKQKVIRKRIDCNKKSETKRLPHPKKGYYYLAKYTYYVRDCKCRVKVNKRVCITSCRKTKNEVLCDRAKREWVKRTITHTLSGCKDCKRTVKERRTPVPCKKNKKRTKHCNKRTGVLTIRWTWYQPSGCKCLKRSSTQSLRCRCPKDVSGRRYCSKSGNAYERKVTYYVLRNGRCLKRRRTVTHGVPCNRRLYYKNVCKPKSGVKITYVGHMKPVRCVCKIRWRVHKRSRCNCKPENLRVKKVVVRRCDKRKNLKVLVRFYYVLENGRCCKRSRKSYRGFRCPGAYLERKNCDERRRKQVVLKHYSVKRNCKCKRLVHRYTVKCGCAGKRSEKKKYCKKFSGTIVTVKITRRWSNKKNQCVTKKSETRHRVLCRKKTRHVNSKCINNKYYVETKIYHVRKSCKCVRRESKKKRNCHCKRIIRRKGCPRNGNFRLVLIKIRRWDMKTRRCTTKRNKTLRIRCRCPKPYSRKYCHNGQWVKKTVRYALRNERCYKNIVLKRRKVICRPKTRHRFTKCGGRSHRYIYTMKRRLNKKKCTCCYDVIKKQRCPCRCKKTTSKRHCIGHNTWKWVFEHHSPLKGLGCGCRKWYKRRTEKVKCQAKRTYKWLKCNRRSCRSSQQVTYYVARNCCCQKQKRLTGKKRECCCLTKPRSTKYCRNSAYYIKRVFYQLRNWKCTRKVSHHKLNNFKCRKNPKTVVKRCNTRTCRQRVYTEISVVDKPRCKCRRVARNHRSRRCCCNKPSERVKVCRKNRFVTRIKRYIFKPGRRVCSSSIKKKIHPPVRCKKTKRVYGKCNRSSCRQRYSIVSYSVKQCKCKKRVDYGQKVCCCRAPLISLPICRNNRYKVRRKTTWTLRNGRCMRKVKELIDKVSCRSGRTQTLRCNKRTCVERIRHETVRVNKCRCVSSWRETKRLCCCKPHEIRNTRCVRDRYLYLFITPRKLNSKRQCVRGRTKRRLINAVKNCRTYEKRGQCNKRKRYAIVRIYIEKPKKCKCTLARVKRRKVLCRCPGQRVALEGCNKSTCFNKETTIWYESQGKGDNFKCKKHIKVKKIRCCCNQPGKKKVYCDQRTGATNVRHTRYIFHQKSRKCLQRQTTKTIKTLKCNRTKCVAGECNRRTGFLVKKCRHTKRQNSRCKCVQSITRQNIICHCKPDKKTTTCKGNRKRVHIYTQWKLSRKLNRCVKKIKKVTRLLNCPKKTWEKIKCNECRGTKYFYSLRMRRCKCVKKVRKQSVRCCCPKSYHKKRCIRNKLILERVKFKHYKGQCKKTVTKKPLTVNCKRKRTTRSKCKKCVRKHVTRFYHVRDCKCKFSRQKIRHTRCCCPRPSKSTRCKAGVHQKIYKSWKLKDGKCLKKIRIKAKKITCQKSSTKRSACNRSTRKQKVLITSYKRVGCSCKKNLHVKYVLCRCRKSYKKAEKCAGKSKRRVYRIYFKLMRINGKVVCRKQRRFCYWEPCGCPKPTRTIECEPNGRVWKITVCRWELCTRNGRRVCIKRKSVSRKVIRCPGKSIIWGDCKRNRKVRTTITYRPVKCKCQRRVKRRLFACNCGRLSTKKQYCDRKRGKIVTVRKTYYSVRNAKKCSYKSKKSYKAVRCSKRKRYTLLSRKCRIAHHYGWYSKYAVTWEVRSGCKCIVKRKKVLKLCRCKRNSKYTKCSRSGLYYETVKYTYQRRGSLCHPVRTIVRRKVACRDTRVKVVSHKCFKCRRQVTLRQCYVRSCRTRTYRKTGLQNCCYPKPKTSRFCDARKGRWVWVTTSYGLANGKALLKDRDGRVRVYQRKVVSVITKKYKAVRCPRKRVREHCDRRSGRWSKSVTTWERVGCKCDKRTRHRRGKCKCPKKEVRWSKCRNRYRVKTVIYFVLKNHRCQRRVAKRTYLCACQNAREYTVCDRRGNWKTCRVKYQLQFRRQRCVKISKCRKRRQVCSVPSETRGRCIRFKRLIKRHVWHLNKKSCKCRCKTSKRYADCDCHKKNSHRTVCRRGAIVRITLTYKQRGEKCRRKVKEVAKPVHCDGRRRTTVVPRSCIKKPKNKYRGYKRLLIRWQIKRKCKCINKRAYRWVPCLCHLIDKYRTRKTKRCVKGSTIVYRTVYYKLIRGVCVKKVKEVKKHVDCDGFKSSPSKCIRNRYGDYYSVIRIFKKVCNGRCGCIWRHHSTKYRICRCRSTQFSKKCINNRVWQFRTIRFIRGPGKVCKRRATQKSRRIHCNKKLITKYGKCSKNCRFFKYIYAYRPKKCKCVKTLIRRVRLSCCCPKSFTKHSCDAQRHLKLATTYTYTLKNYRCELKKTVQSKRVRCGRKSPKYKEAKCNKKGYKNISKTVYFAEGCKCSPKTTTFPQRCSCPSRKIYRKGRCGRWFAHDVWVGFKLKATGKKFPGTNKPIKKCVKYVVYRRKRRCRCPKSYTRPLCRQHNIRVVIHVSYKIVGNSCERKRTESRKVLPCSRRSQLVRKVTQPRNCSKRNGYIQTNTYTYRQAKNCRCITFTRRVKRICDCLKKYGKKKETKCVGHNLKVTRITWRVPKSNGCAGKSKKIEHRIRCKGQRITRGNCERNGYRIYSLYQKRARNCCCEWKLRKRVRVKCRCPKKKVTKRCHLNKWKTIVTRWVLAGSKFKTYCKAIKKIKRKPVPCKVGSSVVRTSCNYRGIQYIVTTVRSLRNCRCTKSVKKRRCRCSCRKPRIKRYCRNGREWVTVTSKSTPYKCECISKSSVSRKPVTCPKSQCITHKCKRGRNGDKYKQTSCTTWLHNKCKCRRINKTKLTVCGCDRRRKVTRKCLGGINEITRVTERRIVRGRCRRMQISKKRRRVRCGRDKVQRVCDKKSGKLSVFVTKPYVKRCRCFKKVTRYVRRCGCHGKKKVKPGKCNRKTCRQRLSFAEQVLKNEKCIWKRYHRYRVCCCKGYRKQVKCLRRSGIVVTTITKRVLKNWRCVQRVIRLKKKVKCKKIKTAKKKKLPRGVLKIVCCKIVRRGCKCVKKCKIVFRRYECQKPVKKTVCKCSGGRCYRHTRTTTWKLVRGRCVRQTSRKNTPTRCPSKTYHKTRCNQRIKYGYYFVKTLVTYYQKDCRCIKKVHRYSIVCRCFKPTTSTYCRRGHKIVDKVTYQLTRGRCLKKLQRKSRAVRCQNKWRFSHNTRPNRNHVFYKVYVRYVRSGCKCIKKYKRVSCMSKCRKCSVKRKCEGGTRNVEIKTCYRLIGCRCVRNVKYTRKRVRCPGPSTDMKCYGCEKRISIQRHHIDKCRCIPTIQRLKRKCCCPKKKLTKTCTKRGSILIRLVTYRLRNSRCYAKTQDSYKKVCCRRHIFRKLVGKCKRGKQKYSELFWKKIGCRCVRRVRYVYRKCVCAHKAVELFLVVDLYGKDRRGYKHRVVSFLTTVANYFKHTSARVQVTIISYNSNVYVHKLKHDRNLPLRAFTKGKTDLYGALKAVNQRLSSRTDSGVEKIVVIISCGNHRNRRKALTMAEKIRRKAVILTIGLLPIPKYGKYIKWLSSKPVEEHYMELGIHRKYHFSATRAFEKICKRACAKPYVKKSSCNKRSCRRVYTRVSFYLDKKKKKCVRKYYRWHKVCCCTKRDRTIRVCRKNRLYKVVYKYRFRSHACHERIYRKDISPSVYAKCKPHISYERGPCRRNGWKKVTKVTRRVVDCQCRTFKKPKHIRCRCPESHVKKTCERGNRVRQCRISYRLTPSACIKQSRCSSSLVKCKPRKSYPGKCSRTSCLRRIQTVWYVVRNCKCQRRTKTRREICCCKRQYQKYRVCDKRRNVHVYIESWFKFHNCGCRKIVRKKIQPVRCARRKTRVFECVAMKRGFYQKRIEYRYSKKNCVCKEHPIVSYRLCRCKRSHRKKICRSGWWVIIEHYFKKVRNDCIPKKRTVSRHRVTCDSKRRNKIGKCNIAKGDRWYARVVQRWKIRVGCHCKTRFRVFNKLCRCPKPFKRFACHRNYRKVLTIYRYILHRNRCQIRKSSKITLIRCPKAQTKMLPCHGKNQSVEVVLYKAKNCRCVSKIYKRVVRCKVKCRDLLPTKICRKWAANKKIRLCDKYPYFAKRLCAATCHRCYTCPKTRLVYAGPVCISRQSHFPRAFLLGERTSFERCMRSCRKNRKCRAFDYDHASRKCRLLSVNRNGFLLRYPSVRLRKTPGCILFERVCPKKCRFRHVLKRYPCRCIKFGKIRLCYRKAAVASYRRGRSGRCERRVSKMLIPCRECEDRRSWCKKSAKCSKHLVRHLCNFSCGVCKRKPRGYIRRTKCSKSGWRTVTRVNVNYDKALRLWRVRLSIKRERCVRCPIGQYRLIGQCRKGKRKLTKIVAKFHNGQCRVIAHKKFVSCKGCSLETKQDIGKCKRYGKRWIRKVVTHFTMRLNGRCIVRRSLAVYSCSPKCKRRRTTVSKCKCGKRIRCTHYFITYPGSNTCVKKRYTTSEKCVPIKPCYDVISTADCQAAKAVGSGMCWRMRMLCPRTCGYCKK